MIYVDFHPMIFSTELRRRRLAAGLSLTELSKLLHYSKSHLSKIETGNKRATVEFARRCDAALGCGGDLARLVARPAAAVSVPEWSDANGVWALIMGPNGATRFTEFTRREALGGMLAPTAGMLLVGLSPAAAPPAGADGSALGGFRLIFEQTRVLGQQLSPESLLPILVGQTYATRTLGEQSDGDARAGAFRLASRFAEYTGWIAQESGHDGQAAWWTDRAVEYASAGGDDGMAAYALVRRALIAMYQQDAPRTIALAETALRAKVRPRIRGLAAQRVAQGHALAGDRGACLRALAQARTLLAADPGDDDPAIGSTHVPDPVAAATGWALYDLGSPAEAARILGAELDRIPATAHRARSRYGARLALALAGAGRVDEACALAHPMIDAYRLTRSATVRVDLRELTRVLRRWPAHQPARAVGLRLIEALHV